MGRTQPSSVSSRGTSRALRARKRAMLAPSLRKLNCWRRTILLRIPPKDQRHLSKAPSKAMPTAAATTANTLWALALMVRAVDNLRRRISMSPRGINRARKSEGQSQGFGRCWRSYCQCAGPSPRSHFREQENTSHFLSGKQQLASRSLGDPSRHPARKRRSVVDMLCSAVRIDMVQPCGT